ncbi:TetR/AcrR family transcriptional regulator C-terminal domain-containing protein [Cellulomonas sp.]|uniref:TetR/AcrR family transcriptional regulator n=1 Tax=Cellulomonas sp. TaxID=40001 RepID=UPI0025BF2B18|nr:TetR/AcrR family transcriptional regulator C-terminal domain-containing protein [Cellulomonas sp.]
MPPVREALSRDRVVAGGVAIADADGLAAVTMRRVAAELECEAMSLYHHVPSKDALLAALADEATRLVVQATAAVTAPTGVDAVRRRCLAAREVMLRHPWAPGLIGAQQHTPPSAWALYEQLVGTLSEAGFDDDLAHRAIHSLGSMVFGFSTELFEPDSGDATPDPDTMAMMAQQMPHLARMAASVVHEVDGALSVCDTRAEFEFTLGLVLDGLERERVRRAAG